MTVHVCCVLMLMKSQFPKAHKDRNCGVLRRGSPFLPCVLSVIFSAPAFAQEVLPAIEIGTPKPSPNRGASGGGATTGAPAAIEQAADGNGTQIGPGNNGQICADGICNNPTSYAAPIESLGTKVNTPVMDTPVTTKMVTQQMLRDQQVITIDQALKDVSGVAFSGGGNAAVGNAFTQIILRGFPTQNYFRDGFRIDSFGVGGFGTSAGVASVNMANVESVEVLKGPAAILYGAVEPGGIVNINTKQPLDKPAFSLQQQFGSYAAYRTVLDATGPVTQNKDLLYRVIMSYENDRSFRSLDYARNFMINPVLRWNIDGGTWIRASSQFQRNNMNQDNFFTPYFGMFSPLWLGRSFNWGPRSPYNQQENFTEVTFHHDFNKDWSFQQTAFVQLFQNNMLNNGGSSFITDCVTPGSTSCYLPYSPYYPPLQNSVVLFNTSSPLNTRQAEYSTQANLVGHFETGFLKHTLLSGADYYRLNFRSSYLYTAYPEQIGLFGAPVPYSPAYNAYPGSATTQYSDNVGVYLQDQIKLPYGFNVLAGARWQYLNSRTGTSNSDICGPFAINPVAGLVFPCNYDAILTTKQLVGQRVTPRAGLLWRPLEWISFYGNYTQSYSPNYNGRLVYGTNDPAPPSAGEQEEGGFKLSLFDGRLQATAAYYHLVKTNIPVSLPFSFTSSFQYVNVVGQARSQGPELDIQGELLPGWSVNLAYANTDAIIAKTKLNQLSAPAPGQPVPFVPRNVGALSSAYEFKDGLLKGLRVGARYDYTGYLPFAHTANDGTYIVGQSTPSYGLIGLFGAYEYNFDKYKVIAQLNVSNLLDKTYFVTGGLGPTAFDPYHPYGGAFLTKPESIGWNMQQLNFNVIGAPRTFRGSIKVSF